MPQPYKLDDLNLTKQSEIRAIVKKFPDIKALLFKDGEYLMQEKDAGTDTFIVLRGNYVVEQSSSEPGKRPPGTLDIVTDDKDSISFIGEMAHLGGGVRTASVRSSGDTYTLKLRPEYMDSIIDEFPFFTNVLCRQLTARLTEANRIIQDLDERFSMTSEFIMKQPGEVLMKKGEQAETLYQLADGSLIRVSTNEILFPDPAYVGFIDPGPFFRDGTYASTIEAKSVSYLTAISRESKLSVIRNFPELILRLYGEASP